MSCAHRCASSLSTSFARIPRSSLSSTHHPSALFPSPPPSVTIFGATEYVTSRFGASAPHQRPAQCRRAPLERASQPSPPPLCREPSGAVSVPHVRRLPRRYRCCLCTLDVAIDALCVCIHPVLLECYLMRIPLVADRRSLEYVFRHVVIS